MGLLGTKPVCGVCGKKLGMNRFKIWKDKAWCCPDCLKKAQNGANGKRIVNCMTISINELKQLVANPNSKGQEQIYENIKVNEYRMRCNVCGHIYCYTEGDLMRSRNNTIKATAGTMGSAAAAICGARIDMYAQGARADAARNSVVDYNKCPHCNSTNVSSFDEKTTSSPTTIDSAIDELKKYKELLDTGIITQDDYDTKKKQILGL